MTADPELERGRAMLLRILGPDIVSALTAQHTIEVLLNPDGQLWVEQLGQPLRCLGRREPAAAMSIIRTIAGTVGLEVTRTSPLLECDLLLNDERVAAQVPPVVAAPTFAIRVPASRIFSLDDYVETGTMTSAQADVLRRAVSRHQNILVAGGTSSGKTTLVNALIAAMVAADPGERLVIIEDKRELQCASVQSVQYRTCATVTMTQLLRTTLRMRPDRILVGEVRGPEALDLLMAWNTGHEGGVATVHANSALAALSRLALLISMNAEAPRPLEPLIAEAVHVIVNIQKTTQGRRVREILTVNGYADGSFKTSRSD
jgi:type IV secretion system protein VirB11